MYLNKMQPLDPPVHYGITDRDFLDVHDVQMDLLTGKSHEYDGS